MKKLIINTAITMLIGSAGTILVAWVTDYGKLKDEDKARIEKEIVEDYEGKIKSIIENHKKENEALRDELKTSLAITKEVILHNNKLTVEAIETLTDTNSLVTQSELDSIYNSMLEQ